MLVLSLFYGQFPFKSVCSLRIMKHFHLKLIMITHAYHPTTLVKLIYVRSSVCEMSV